jgi:hypothetical protein
MRMHLVIALFAAAVTVAGCADDSSPSAEQSAQPSATAAATESSTAGPIEPQQLPPLPDGWRWESYRDVVVGVPGDWAYTGGRISDWCAAEGKDPKPGVGRPGAVLSIGCPQPSPGEPDPGSLLKNGGTYVAFASTEQNLKTEGDRDVLTLGSTAVVIQAPEALRAQIAETVQQRNDVDHNGCPITHPISSDPSWRPSPVDPAVFEDVTSMTACRYDLRTARNEPLPADAPTLVSSVQVSGAKARSTAAAIAASPTGGGPDDPSSCTEDTWYGDEVIVVRLDRPDGAPEYLVVRYSGCNHNGIDDGTVVHPLTVDNARPFFSGSNWISSFSGPSSKMAIIHPESATAAK